MVGKNVCVNFKTDTHKLIFFEFRYRNSLHFEDNEVDLKLTEHQLLLAKQVYLLSYFDIFYKLCVVLDETTFVKNGSSVSNEHIPILPGIKNVVWAQ